MVGDWVDYNNTSLITHRIKLELFDFFLMDCVIKNNDYTVVCQPIPLTVTILDKIKGIIKDERTFYNGYIFEDIRITVHSVYGICYIGKGNIVTLPHLHTFQQLIRLFTNKEIEIEW